MHSRDTYEYVFINFFRAIASFWVLSVHCMIWGNWRGIPLPDAKLAVDLFMLISGFLMAANAHVRTREPLTEQRNRTRFWMRRFFRIAPAYYFVLAVTFIAGDLYVGGLNQLQALNPQGWARSIWAVTRFDTSLANALMHITFIFGPHQYYSRSAFLPDWSISLEMHFYAVFPFLMLLLLRAGILRAGIVVALVSFAIGVAIIKTILVFPPALLFLKLTYFIAGTLIFYAVVKRSRTLGLASVTLTCLEIHFGARYGLQGTATPIIATLMLLLGRMEVLGTTPRLVAVAINSRLVRFASETSYSVYLCHLFFISLFGWLLSMLGHDFFAAPTRVLVMFVFVVVGTYAAAYVIYQRIELPGIAFGKAAMDAVAPRRVSQH